MIIKVFDGYESKYKGTEVDEAIGRAQGAVSLDGDNVFTGSNEFQGDVILGTKAVVPTPDLTDSSRKVANTEYVQRQNYLKTITADMITTALGYVPQDIANLVTTLSASSTDEQYPSAKAVYEITSSSGSIIDEHTSLLEEHTSAITENTANISSNTSLLEVHTSAISSNTSSIQANATNISSNTSLLEVHTTLIASNTTSIQTNSSAIAVNTSSIAANTSTIAQHTSLLAEHTSAILNNTSSIQANASTIATNTSDISTINSKIPATATSTNQLTDRDFVNSSIATSTATFRGTFNSLADLEAYSGPKDDNDYAFVIATDTAGNTLYNRYKYTGSAWLFEYSLNNSSFTADQWAAINSNITSSGVSQIATNTSAIANLGTNKQDVITDLETIRAGASAGATAIQPNDNITELNNNAGYISGITSSMVIDALTYTPYNSTNPSGYQANVLETVKVNDTVLTPSNKTVNITVPTSTTQLTNDSGYITSISSTDVTNALGYIPYNSTNPSGYQANVIETVKVNNTALTPSNKAVNITVPTSTTQLTNDSGYITGITSTMVTSALGYTPYDSTNPSGYISSITSTDVTNALGYTPYNSTNPSGYISSVSVSILTDVTLSNLSNGQALLYNTVTKKWTNSNVVTSVSWGEITGSLSDQADLQSVLDSKTTMAAVEAKGYLTSITSTDVTTALGYTAYDGATNPNGYIAGISYNMVTNALGYTPESASNLVTTISSVSTDSTYPSAKAVYMAIENSRPTYSVSYDDSTEMLSINYGGFS